MGKSTVKRKEDAFDHAAHALYRAMGGTEEGWFRSSLANKARYRAYVEPAIRRYLELETPESLVS